MKPLKPRDKVTQRMTRDGLTVDNQTTGESVNVSSREAEQVRGLNMTPEEFAAFVRGGALQAPPAPQPDFEQDEQEGNADEE